MTPRYLISFGLLAACVGIVGCATRAMTPPRSEIISQSNGQGLPTLSADEERAAFFAVEEGQRSRLLRLIQQRSGGEFRDNSYRIGPADEIEVNVFDVPELNLKAAVNQSGIISLPLIGAVQAGGRTEAELHADLTTKLSSYVRNPQVVLSVSQFGSQKVAVLGAVQKPGTYPLRKGANSILELLSEAGGLNERAGNFINFIPAELSGLGSSNNVEARARLALATSSPSAHSNSGIEIYLEQVLGTSGGIPLEIPVRGGDMIILPEAGKVMVEGEVQKVGQYELGQQMTLLGALAASGGISYGAKIDEVEVIRDRGADSKLHLVLDLTKLARGEEHDVRLRNGDIVRVPSDSGRRMTQDTFEGISRIINLGVGGQVNLVK